VASAGVWLSWRRPFALEPACDALHREKDKAPLDEPAVVREGHDGRRPQGFHDNLLVDVLLVHRWGLGPESTRCSD